MFHILPQAVKTGLIKKLSLRGSLKHHHFKKLLHAKIHSLNLSSCVVSENDLYAIANACKNLQKLDVNSENNSRNDITVNGIKAVAASCKMLHTLYLRRCLLMNDAAIVVVATQCLHLRHLNIGGCYHVSDIAIISLANHSCNLTSLNISLTQITDNGVCALANGVCHQNIQEVHMAGCSALTDFGVSELVNKCRQLNILILHNCSQITSKTWESLEVLQRRGSKQISWTIR
ncbi:protein AMN1 homolog [Xenia sp. Carnegie-2017]|uniref:protein AMN1 homolog n=1 Tax=Xenia sp. Carnegie-2017 TaxID=2897299 RepID=UPI001F033FFF|nr:protein AMN1 homolog [Xenia sp. Carnegie-2017]